MSKHFGLNAPGVNAFSNFLVLVGLCVAVGRGVGSNPRLRDWAQNHRIRGLTEGEWVSATSHASVLGGSETGRVDVLLFADYECPFCRQQHEELETFRKSHPTVLIGVVQMPLTTIHRVAESAARAAVCAGDQGRFTEMHGLLYSDTIWYRDQDWERLGRSAGVGSNERFVRCVEGTEVGEGLQRDLRLAREWGVDVTPTLVTRRGIYPGLSGVDRLVEEFAHRQ